MASEKTAKSLVGGASPRPAHQPVTVMDSSGNLTEQIIHVIPGPSGAGQGAVTLPIALAQAGGLTIPVSFPPAANSVSRIFHIFVFVF